MGKHKFTWHERKKIRREIIEAGFQTNAIRVKYNLSKSLVSKLVEEAIEYKRYELEWMNTQPSPRTKVGFGSKKETYQTEDQMLSSPFYNAKNRERITPINPDWKLF